MTIDSFLLGHWSNVKQCCMYPTDFSHTHILWEKIDGGYESKQWKHRDGRDNPYRHTYHTFEWQKNQILMKSYSTDWTTKQGCVILFTSRGNGWYGTDIGKCYSKDGALISTKMELSPDVIRVYDYGTKDGEFVFGGTKYHEFARIAQR